MEQHPVESTVIEAIGYSRVLEIHFESGRIYQYYDVPADLFDAMLDAPSKGKFFNQNIRGKFRYREIEVKSRGAAPSDTPPAQAPSAPETEGTGE